MTTKEEFNILARHFMALAFPGKTKEKCEMIHGIIGDVVHDCVLRLDHRKKANESFHVASLEEIDQEAYNRLRAYEEGVDCLLLTKQWIIRANSTGALSFRHRGDLHWRTYPDALPIYSVDSEAMAMALIARVSVVCWIDGVPCYTVSHYAEQPFVAFQHIFQETHERLEEQQYQIDQKSDVEAPF